MPLDARILAMKDRKAQDVEIMRTLSMIDELNREYFHKCDDFTEYCDAAAKLAQMVGKPKIEVPKYIPHAMRVEMAAKKKAERAAQKEAALRKVGALPAKGVSPPKGKPAK